MSAAPPLARYNEKRDFGKTPEPAGKAVRTGKTLSFVIQKHWATRLHYDFRLELDGVLVSWAVPKGPSFDPAVKRMAIHVEDHPVSYGTFEGRIPEKQYGAGTVIVWDRGTWEPIGDPRAGLAAGKLVFALHGEKLAGQWELIRIAKPDDRQEAWLLFKKRDAWVRLNDEYDVTVALPDSVVVKPLGPLEERESPAAPEPATPTKGAPTKVAKAKGASAAKQTAAKQSARALPAGAVKASLPEALSPQLATLAKAPPEGGDWSVEAKFDGYRVLARIERGKARLITRNGNDWTDKLDSVAHAVESLGIDDAWLDGELVVARADGGQDFNALQNAIDAGKNTSISYFFFDAPFLAGHDLRRVPLWERRAALKAALEAHPHPRIRFSEDFPSSPAEVLKAACAMRLEGVIVKRRDAHYVSSRNEQWLKLKCTLRQEFVIGGYTDRSNSSKEIGNLLLGVYEDGKLRYAGAMGTGWNLATAAELKKKLATLEIPKSPFETGSTKQGRWSRRLPGIERWVKPELVCEANFAEWTPEGHLRHAVFQGLRADKPPKSIVREQAMDAPAADAPVVSPPAPKRAAKSVTNASTKTATRTAPRTATTTAATRGRASSVELVSGMRVSSPERIIDAASGATKLDLVSYYDRIADLILPHLKDRPVSLVRGPAGVGGELFFQKHLEGKMPGMTVLDESLWPDHASMMQIDTKQALLSAAQMNTIEFHTWNGRSTKIGAPDRFILDLDPGEGVTWQQVQEAAALTRALLEELGLVAFLKTSGGKGLHVVVPIAPKLDWDTVKGFSQAIVQHLAKTIPDRFVAKSGGANRIGKIFVDYLRNGLGATTAVAFSARSRPGLGVSMPVPWEMLMELRSGAQWTIVDAPDYALGRSPDPWAGYAKTRQTLAGAMKRIGYRAAA